MDRPTFLKYDVSGRLAKLLGRESVSTDEAALFELVKNSYDADATKVLIQFKNLEKFQDEYKKLEQIFEKNIAKQKANYPNIDMNEAEKNAKKSLEYVSQKSSVDKLQKETSITIQDNGDGMTIQQLENKWMKIGVEKQEGEKFSQKGRRVVGEKGVGRFAVEKLSSKAIVKARKKDQRYATLLICDWDEFEKSGKDLTTIRLPIKYVNKDPNDHGVTIELSGLREEWTEKKITNFMNQLMTLILPEKVNEKSPFIVNVTYTKNGKIISKNIQSGLLKIAPYKFQTELTKNSMIKFNYLNYKNEQIIPNKRNKHYEGLMEEFPFVHFDEESKKLGQVAIATCGPVKFTFYGFPFDPSGRDLGWKEWYSKTKGSIQNDVEKMSGIKIYRDGFRVRPYGDSNDDWVGAGSQARSTAGKLPPKNIIGWIEISRDENSNILDTTTREKIIENKAFTDLKDFVAESMRRYYNFSEKIRQEIVRKESKTKTPQLIKKISQYIEDNPGIEKQSKIKLISALENIQSELVGEEIRSETKKNELMDELSAYRNLASLGITTGAVSHEIKDYLKKILLHSGVIRRGITGSEIDTKKLKQSLDILQPSVENLSEFMELVSTFTADLSSRKKEFRQKKELRLHDEINDLNNALNELLKRWNIFLENEISKTLPKLLMYKADLQSIFLNLISNSIKSLKILYSERNDSKKKGIIRITTKTDKDNIVIIYSDNGIGIPSYDRDLVFDLFWTRAASHQSVKSGSGLGLPIIRDIIHEYGGEITIENSEIEHGATFKIILPKENMLK
jgi:signal transduction histidine kinase